MKKIIILNGPNLNLLGEREKSQYGNFTLKDIEKTCKEFAKKNNLDISFFQSNMEGELVEKIQESRNDQDGLVINAGGYTHTSVAIHDALKICNLPIIELHISNIYNREEFRHKIADCKSSDERLVEITSVSQPNQTCPFSLPASSRCSDPTQWPEVSCPDICF